MNDDELTPRQRAAMNYGGNVQEQIDRIGKTFAERRAAKGYTAEFVAKAAQMDVRKYEQLERMGLHSLSLHQMHRIAFTLGLSTVIDFIDNPHSESL